MFRHVWTTGIRRVRKKYCELTGISASQAEKESEALLEKSISGVKELHFSSDEKYSSFTDICRKILKKADYQVGEAQKKHGEQSGYLVTVTYRPLPVEETISAEYDSYLETESIPSDGETLYLGDTCSQRCWTAPWRSWSTEKNSPWRYLWRNRTAGWQLKRKSLEGWMTRCLESRK